jgi:hypothetical protein
MEFDWEIYKHLNPDLETAGLKTMYDYIKHYRNNGINEGRRYNVYDVYPDFDYVTYENNYDDLIYLSKINLEKHWLLHGIKENRTYKLVLDKVNKKKDIVDITNKNIFIICNIRAGGTSKYINDLLKYYNNNTFIFIKNRTELYDYSYNNNDIIMVQQLLHIDIKASDLIVIKKLYNCKIIITVHDFCWLNKNIYDYSKFCPHSVYLNYNPIMLEVLELFSLADTVIHPTEFSYKEYSKRMNNNNFKIIPHTDIVCDLNTIFVPKVINTINIGALNQNSEYKGKEYINYLMHNYTSFEGIKINYYVVGVTINEYKEKDFYDIILKYNLHGLLLLNKWGETWSYLLTKCLISGLSILYNNIGSHMYRIKPAENKFIAGYTDNDIPIDRLCSGYEKMLKYILINGANGINKLGISEKIYKDKFYIDLFNK